MKPKYHGIFSLVLSLAALLACGGYYLADAWRLPPMPPQGPPMVADDVKVPSRSQLETMKRLSPKLAGMARPAGTAGETVPMALFGYRPVNLAGHGGKAGDGQTEKDYLLSLTLVSGPKRYCILDGRFLTEGDVLADGSTLVRIEYRKVLLSRHKAKRWIALQEEQPSPDHESFAKGKGQS